MGEAAREELEPIMETRIVDRFSEATRRRIRTGYRFVTAHHRPIAAESERVYASERERERRAHTHTQAG